MTPENGLLQKLGVYIDEYFLSEKECSELRNIMAMSKRFDAGVYKAELKTSALDATIRTTKYCDVPDENHQEIFGRIHALKKTLEEFFQSTFSEMIERPKYLCYQPGDFFAPHTDDGQNRRINISIYLNSQVKQAEQEPSQMLNDVYCGGELKLYGLIKSSGWENRGVTVAGKEGTLVAYPVDLVHEVTPILAGSRFAIVSRFLANTQGSL